MQLTININNESIADKLVWFLKSFQDKGVEIIEDSNEYKANSDNTTYDDQYIKKHWREIGMNTHSTDLDDDERLYEAAAKFYNEKYSD